MNKISLSRNLVFLVLATVLPSSYVFAANWEVAVIFLTADEPAEFQSDVDRNILELARTRPNEKFRLSILREFNDHTVQYFPSNSTAAPASSWDSLFHSPPVLGIQIPGELLSVNQDQNESGQNINQGFLEKAFSYPNSRRILIIYAHGEAYRGLRKIPLSSLQTQLSNGLPKPEQFISGAAQKPLDILWFDSCFMGNFESLYQLRNLSEFFITSEDAEFSAGTPFDILQSLEDGPENTQQLAIDFAKRFIESYSFLKAGSQKDAVAYSSATVNVVESTKLENLMAGLTQLSTSLSSPIVQKKLNRFTPRIAMEKSELVDLGQIVSRLFNTTETKSAVSPLEQILRIRSTIRTKKSPRVLIQPENPGASFLFGYENWTLGDQSDTDLIEHLPQQLRTDKFTLGPNDKAWPYRTVNRRLYLSPFLPGKNIFNFQLLDALTLKPAGPAKSIERKRDYTFTLASHPLNPILFSANTFSIGKDSEKYTGLNIANPTLGIPTLDYLETDFYKATRWGDR